MISGDAIALKTQNEKYFPIDSSFWEWRKGKDIRELDDFYRYINLQEIEYIVNELEKRWPNNDDDNQNGYEKICFKHNIRKPIILATMIRGLSKKGINTSVVTKKERFLRHSSIFSDIHRSSTEHVALYDNFEDYKDHLLSVKKTGDGKLIDTNLIKGQKNIKTLIVASSILKAGSYSFGSDECALVYIDNLPPWEQIDANIKAVIRVNQSNLVIRLIEHDQNLELHKSFFDIINKLKIDNSINVENIINEEVLANLYKSWKKVLDKQSLEDCITTEICNEINQIYIPDHPYTSVNQTILRKIVKNIEWTTIPHNTANFAATWQKCGTMVTGYHEDDDRENLPNNMHDLRIRNKENLLVDTIQSKCKNPLFQERIIIFSNLCPEPRGKVSWTPLFYLKTISQIAITLLARYPERMICIKNKDQRKIEPSIHDLAKEFKNELTKEEVKSIARVLDITHRGGIDEIVEAGNICVFVQDGSSIDKCMYKGCTCILVVDEFGRQLSWIGAGNRFDSHRISISKNLRLLTINRRFNL